MANVLILCAVCPVGDAFWDRWLKSGTLECGDRQGPLVRLTAADIVPAGRATASDSAAIRQTLRTRMPGGRIDLLQVAIAVAGDAPDPLPRLEALLAALAGISSVPAKVSVMVLSPDVALRSTEGATVVRDLLAATRGGPVGCGDICWVRVEAGSGGAVEDPIPRTCVRAAVHPVWSEDTGSRQPLALLQGLESPCRDSISCRLVFDRAAWLRYAAADVDRRLTEFIRAPLPGEAQRGVPEWVQGLWRRVLTAAGSAAAPRATPPPRPSNLFAPDPMGSLPETAKKMGNDARSRAATELAGQEASVVGGAAEEIARHINEAAALGGDDLQSLVHAFSRCEVMLAEIARQSIEPDPIREALKKAWIVALNHAHKALAESVSIAPFDPASPATWSQRVAEWQILQDTVERRPNRRQEPAACVAAWASRLLPAAFEDEPRPEAIWEAVVEPLAEALAGQESAAARVLAEHKAERARIETDYPVPPGAVTQFLFGRARDRNVRRARQACDRQYVARLEAIYHVVDTLSHAAADLFELAVRQESLARVTSLLVKTATEIAAPILNTFRAFLDRHRRSCQALDGFPAQPDASPDTLGLLSKAELAALSAHIDPEPGKWLAAARMLTPTIDHTWQTVADACLATLDAWSATRARDLPVDLPELLVARFPQLAAMRLVRLAEMARGLLLPVQNRNATRRHLHQQWHLPADLRLEAHPALDASTVRDIIVSTSPTSVTRLPLNDRDRLELHLHLLGFKPEDCQYWDLLPGTGRSGVASPLIESAFAKEKLGS